MIPEVKVDDRWGRSIRSSEIAHELGGLSCALNGGDTSEDAVTRAICSLSPKLGNVAVGNFTD